jgi:predicted nucleic acid-binding protein
MARALLDINVLIALHDEDHVFHERAHRWWKTHAQGAGLVVR